MQRIIDNVLTIQHPDEDWRRRGQNVIVLAVGLMLVVLLSLPMALSSQRAPDLVAIFISVFVFSMAVFLSRRGYVTLAAVLILAVCILGALAPMLFSTQIQDTPFFFAVGLLVAGVTLRPQAIWIVLFVIFGMLGLLIYPLTNQLQQPVSPVRIVVNSGLLCFFAALTGWVGANSTSRALADAQQARWQAEQSAVALDRANGALEQQVAERTTALRAALVEVEVRVERQAALLKQIEQQHSVILELGVPVLPIDAATLVMPLVGALDSARLRQMQERALQAVEQTSARRLLLDITGTPIVDTQVAHGLIGLVSAARLLGTEVVLVGIRPEVAQSIVELGVDLQMIRTFSSLETALKGR